MTGPYERHRTVVGDYIVSTVIYGNGYRTAAIRKDNGEHVEHFDFGHPHTSREHAAMVRRAMRRFK